MIPAWLDPEVPALTMPIYAECSGGKHDGHMQAVTDDTTILWVGPLKAAWTIEAGLPPGTETREGLFKYEWNGRVKDDGTRIYEWVPDP